MPESVPAGGVVFATFNPKELYRTDARSENARYRIVEALISTLGPDVIALQELPGETLAAAHRGLRRLAERTGMRCKLNEADGPAYAAVPGGHDELGLGLMWRPGIEPVPGTWRAISGAPLWHALVSVQLDLGGPRVTHASYHAPPRRGQERRSAEAEIVAERLTGRGPVLIGADWNGLGAERIGGAYYDPDPNADLGSLGFPDQANKKPVIPVDRTPAQSLAGYGLVDAAWSIGAPWEPTTGHWPTERNGWRRLDIIRVTADIVGALRGYFVINSPRARAASDHLPVLVQYDPNAVGQDAHWPSPERK